MMLKPARRLEEFVYVGVEGSWFRQKYYYTGGNFRYHSFHIALNLLYQECEAPLIVETGCQRQKDDVGAGMSTSIFGEYAKRHGGRVFTVDNDPNALAVCRACTAEFADRITYTCSDSVKYLSALKERPDLLYLDSFDYDLNGNAAQQQLSQQHCLNELKAVEPRLSERAIVLLDDNDFPGGGKPKLAKRHLSERGWTCLIDQQQSLWIRNR